MVSTEQCDVSRVRPCREDERSAILNIINLAARAYRGVIPAERWHDPYMPLREFEAGHSHRLFLVGWRRPRRGAVLGRIWLWRRTMPGWRPISLGRSLKADSVIGQTFVSPLHSLV